MVKDAIKTRTDASSVRMN